jgi:Colicin V production protein
MRAGTGPQARTLADISADIDKGFNDLAGLLEQILNPDDAKNQIEKMNGIFDRLTKLAAESKSAYDAASNDARQRFIDDGNEGAKKVAETLPKLKTKVPNLPPEFVKAVMDGSQKVDQAVTAATASAPQVRPEMMGSKPPEGSAWAMWLLAMFIIAACVGFLIREGIWGNAIRLVNVVFAGLLTMNFYEPVAQFLTKPGDLWSTLRYDDLHSWTPFFDFLGFWICFIFFVAVLMIITDSVSRVRVRFLQIVERIGSPLIAFCIGWVMTGIVLVSLHLSPLGEYPFLGCFQPQSNMFIGLFAPDREWLGFTKYQSSNGYSRSVANERDLKLARFDDAGDRNFIDKHWKRRIEIEQYVRGNGDHRILVNPKFIKTP